MGFTTAFNFQAFTTLFPELAYVGAPMTDVYFGIAETLHRNDGSFPTRNQTQQDNMMYFLTAHLTFLLAPDKAGNQRDVVGRLTDVSEGSVSASLELDFKSEAASAQWFNQTRYGSTYWQMVKYVRIGGRYIPGICRRGAAWPAWQYPNSSNGFWG